MQIWYADEEHDSHLVEPCFYAPGEVAQLEAGQRRVSIQVKGHARAVHLDTEQLLDSPHAFRNAFPSGVTDADEWEWLESGCFLVQCLEDEDSEWSELSEEYATLDEAVDAAVGVLAG